ncbi:MAG: hypothetical protein SF069_10500 [Phycisphaerae bacterium]|nr:hypothetical protein [Phycisphaerae bacterium]
MAEHRTPDAPPIDLARQQHLANLSAILAHEINNLMTPIVTRADFALGSGDSALIHRSLEKCLAQAQRVVGLTRRLSDYAEKSTRSPTPTTAAPVRSAVDAACELLVRPPEKDGIEYKIEVDAALTATFDADDLVSVVLNLLLIALERVRPQRGWVRVRADRGALRVEDGGGGLSADAIAGLNYAIAAWEQHPSPVDAPALDVRLRAAVLLCSRNGATLRVEAGSGQALVVTFGSN